MRKIRLWFFKQSLKEPEVVSIINKKNRIEAISYNQWLSLLPKTGFPKNDNGTMMDIWQLYEYYYKTSGKRNSYAAHAEKYL